MLLNNLKKILSKIIEDVCRDKIKGHLPTLCINQCISQIYITVHGNLENIVKRELGDINSASFRKNDNETNSF